MKLDSDEIERWKFIGNFLVRGWVYTGPGEDSEVYIEDTLRQFPKILSNRLWFQVLGDDDGEEKYFNDIVNGKISKSDLVYDKSKITNDVDLAFISLVESLWDSNIDSEIELDREWFVKNIIEEPSASELMFVVVANNIELNEAGKIINLEYSYKRGVQAALSNLDPSFKIIPKIEPWEAIG